MQTFTFTVAAVVAVLSCAPWAAQSRPALGGTFCAKLSPHLPRFCKCTETVAQVITLDCNTTIIGAIIDVEAVLAPCAKPDAYVDFTASVGPEKFTKHINAGDKGTYPIPGLEFKLPIIGEVDAVLDYDVEGDAEDIEVYLAIDGCLASGSCASTLDPALFPIKIINDTIALDDCNNWAEQ